MTWFWKRRRESPPSPQKTRPTVLIHEAIVSESERLLRDVGDEHAAHEGVVYWAGRSADGHCLITTCIAPKASTTWGSFDTSMAANAEVISFLARHRLELLAQVHSHPGPYVDHSTGDDCGALMPYENYLSIVVPHYAQHGLSPLNNCGIHRFESGQFRRLTDEEIDESFSIVPTCQSFR